MRGYVDTTAEQIQSGDTVIDPISGVLARVESVEPVNEKGVVTLHMRGSVSLGYMGIVAKPDRPIRRAPRATETGPDPFLGTPERMARRYGNFAAGLCACGKRLERECADECVR